LDPARNRHLQVVRPPQDISAATDDLRSAFGAIAGWLAPAVGAKVALVIAAVPEGYESDGSVEDVLIQHMEGHRAVVVVVPSSAGEARPDSGPLGECLTLRQVGGAITAELLRSRRTQVPFSIGFVDAGGPAGDELALNQVGQALAAAARPTDLVGQYGDGQFLVVMADTDAEQAATACADLVTDAAAEAGTTGMPELTLSFGTATWAEGKLADGLIDEADQAMFSAKRARGG
jgi:diguanylate cyclase (GGDEF)-like protein